MDVDLIVFLFYRMNELRMIEYVESFKNDGFCVYRQAISKKLIDEANDQVSAFRRRNDRLLSANDLLVDGMLQRVVNLHFSVTALQNIFLSAMEAGQEVVDCYGKATLYTSLFFELGSQQSLHRDTPYFYSGGDGGYMGVWVALDDVDENNGALLVVRGSHKLPEPDLEGLRQRFHPSGEVPPSSTPLFNAYNEELVSASSRIGLSPMVCTVKKGDMIIWNPATLHGGLPHRDKTRSRRSFVMHITPQDMPMKHMDYFFHRDKEIEKVKKQYSSVGDRLISAGDLVDFRHIKSFCVDDLGFFG